MVEPELREKALARLEENKRYSGGKPGRRYLLRGLVTCAYCATACTGDLSVSSMGYRYHYYSCRKKRSTQYDARHAKRGYSCPKVKASWLEELVWSDVRSFLENPGEVLERVREQLSGDRRARTYKSVMRPSRTAWRQNRTRKRATSDSSPKGTWTSTS